MTTIVTRSGKGSPLTHTEVDTNFTNLNTNKLETAAIPLGTAAAPSISFLSDADSGLFSPGANQVAVATNGTGRLFIDASGNVGVGTSAPISNAGYGNVTMNGADGAILSMMQGGTETFRVTNATGYSFINTTGATPILFGTAATERLRITPGGLVGIGTSSPAGKLHVIGDSATAGVGNINISNAAFPTSGWAFRIPDSAATIDLSLDGAIGGTFRSVMYFARGTGNVGIGSTSPGTELQISATTPTIRLEENGAGSKRLELSVNSSAEAKVFATQSGSALLFGTVGTERARIDSSGRLLVGTSTARDNFNSSVSGTASQAQLEGTTYQTSSSSLTCTSTTTAQRSILYFGKSAGSSVGSNTLVANSEYLGDILFQGNDGTKFVEAALIRAQIDGTPGANDMPGRLVFSTTADGAASPTEAMRINSQQELLVGPTTRNANGGVLQLKSGITFPATAVAASDANTLDDYEEGTWTPTYYGSTTAGTTTYTSQEGQYTKIGRTVTVHAQISISAATGTGEVYFGGFPFAIDPAFFYCVGTVAVSGVNWGGGTYLVLLSGGTTTAQPIYLSDDAVFANQAVVNESQVWRFTYSYNV